MALRSLAGPRRRGCGSVPSSSPWRNARERVRTPSYFEPQERRVLLCAIDVAVARIAGHDVARNHDLNGTAERIVYHLHGGGGHAVKRRDLLGGQRLRLGRALVIGISAKDDV